MNFSFGSLFASLFVSGAGYVFYKFGRKKTRPVFVIFGICMMIYPYFVSDFFYMVGIAIGLSALLFWLKQRGY